MSRQVVRSLRLSAPLLLLSQAALADLTAAEVWGDWRGYMEGMGYQVQASEQPSGANLVVSNINLSFPIPDNGGQVAMSLGTITFVQNGDGTVNVIMPDTLPMQISANDGTGNAEFAASLRFVQTNHQIIASGISDDVTYDYNAASFAVTLDGLEVDGETFGQDQARVDISGSNLISSTSMKLGDLRQYTQTGSVEAVTYDIFLAPPDEPTQMTITGSLADLGISGSGTLPKTLPSTSDVAAMLAAGFDVAGALTFGAGQTVTAVRSETDGNADVTTTSSGGRLGVKMGQDGIAYDIAQTDTKMAMTVPDLPFPIEFTMANTTFNLSAPTTLSDAEQDFTFGMTLEQFSMSDAIWSIFDPGAQLPRNPATIILDVAGKATLLVDYLDPKALEAAGSAPPAALNAVTLNNLTLDAVGARLNGDGAVTINTDGAPLVPGLGTPVGAVNFNLEGANALIDTLVNMGLLPQEQAMGARMMMGLFAVPGDGPDSLKSTIEMTADGQILANGQRIR